MLGVCFVTEPLKAVEQVCAWCVLGMCFTREPLIALAQVCARYVLGMCFIGRLIDSTQGMCLGMRSMCKPLRPEQNGTSRLKRDPASRALAKKAKFPHERLLSLTVFTQLFRLQNERRISSL